MRRHLHLWQSEKNSMQVEEGTMWTNSSSLVWKIYKGNVVYEVQTESGRSYTIYQAFNFKERHNAQ